MQVRLVEEPYLLRAHGHDHRAYAARTGRFLPGVGRLSTPDSHHTGGHHHHEHDGHDAHGGHDGDDHAGRGHSINADADRRWLTVALAAIAGFMAVEPA